MTNKIKLSDLKEYNGMYNISSIVEDYDGSDWVDEEQALEIIDYINEQVDLVIDTINENNFDGETMQFILKEVGMEWQMLRQLILEAPMEQVEYLMEEKRDLEGNIPF
ncbi:hypothetical protein EBT16_14205 [bacterium]|nr:hypothetical protein [bacterium]